MSPSKQDRRRDLLKQRKTGSGATRSAESGALRDVLRRWISENRMTTVCAYVPVGSEPGSTDLLDDLRDTGCRVLLPVVVGQQPLDWSEYEGPGSLQAAGYGLREPIGTRAGPGAIGEADVVLVPALAVDRRGVRLGRGGGHYDRSLPLAGRDTVLAAVVRDEEFVESLPGEAHDVLVGAVATPGGGVAELPRPDPASADSRGDAPVT